jgi:hypothetical protein
VGNITLLNPEEMINELFKFDGFEGKYRLGHIKYDKSLNKDFDYQIIIELSHDGTVLFTYQVVREALKPLVNRTIYCKKDVSEDIVDSIKDIEYTIGDIKIEKTYGMINSKAGSIRGVTDKVSIPVRCKYEF